MSTLELGDRLWFQVPTPVGLIDVVVPEDMSAHDANIGAERVRAVLRAMFAVVDSKPSHISGDWTCVACGATGIPDGERHRDCPAERPVMRPVMDWGL